MQTGSSDINARKLMRLGNKFVKLPTKYLEVDNIMSFRKSKKWRLLVLV